MFSKILTSRFSNIPEAVLDEIRRSPEFQRAYLQTLFNDERLKLHIGKKDIVTTGYIPDIYVVQGFIKAALVNMGVRGKAVIPESESGDWFTCFKETPN